MSDDHQAARQRSQRNRTLYTVIETIIYEADARACEKQFCIFEPQAMFKVIAAILGEVPFERHRL